MAENSGSEQRIDLYDIRDFMEDASSKLPPGMADSVTLLCEIAEFAYKREKSRKKNGGFHITTQWYKNELLKLLNKFDFNDDYPITFDNEFYGEQEPEGVQ